MAPVYRPKERTIRVQAYVLETFQQRMLKLGRLWSLIDRVNDDAKRQKNPDHPKEPLKERTEAEVMKRLLEVASNAAWDEVEGGEPQTEEEWARLEAKFAKAVKSSK